MSPNFNWNSRIMVLGQRLIRRALGWLVAAVALTGAAAHAQTIYSLDVTNIASNGELGDLANEVRTLNLGGEAHVIGLAWSVTLTADAPSWLSEIGVDIGSSLGGLSLFPGFGTNAPGTGNYASGGFIDLVAESADFFVGSDGMLRLEFFDRIDDLAGVDGRWIVGAIALQVTAIPEPGAAALMLLGLATVAAGAVRRRRALSAA